MPTVVTTPTNENTTHFAVVDGRQGVKVHCGEVFYNVVVDVESTAYLAVPSVLRFTSRPQ
jgi:hypothetical protein